MKKQFMQLIRRPIIVTIGAAFFTVGIVQFPAQAIQISLDRFGTNAVVESFEGLSPGTNIIPLFNGSGTLKVGVDGQPIIFGSGVTLTGPLPSEFPPSAVGLQIGDWSIGSAGFGLGENGSISSVNDVPDGSAYLDLDAAPGPIEFTFDSDIFRVGALVTGNTSSIILSAFDASNQLLETVSVPTVDVSAWSFNFLGIENTRGIRKVTFSNNDTSIGFNVLVIDKLTFETPSLSTQVPEPTSVLSLLMFGVLGSGILKINVNRNL